MSGPNVNIDLRGQLAQTGGVLYLGARTITEGPVVVSDADFTLVVNQDTPGALSIPLPDSADLSEEPGSRRLRIFDDKGDASTNNITVTGTGGALIDGAASVVISEDWGSLDLEWRGTYWTVLNKLSAAPTPAAHAPSHKAGGPDDLLSDPGPIGGGTPAAGAFTTVDAATITAATSHEGPVGAVVPSTGAFTSVELAGVLPSAASNVVSLGGSQYAGNVAGLALANESGSILVARMLATTGTGIAAIDVLPIELADDATYDYESGGRGGFAIVVAPAAGSSTWGACSFAQDGVTELNGLVFTNFAVADTDTKLCAYTSGTNKLRIKNRLGSTQNILLIVFPHIAN